MIEYYPIEADAVTALWRHVFDAESPETPITLPAVKLFAALAMIDKLPPAETPQLDLKLPSHWQPVVPQGA